LAPSAPSGYILGAFGVGDLSAPFENVNPDTGSAFMFGGGYEFNNNFMFEATLLKANIQVLASIRLPSNHRRFSSR